MHGRSFWKTADKFIEELLGADLKVECVATILDANVEELCQGELCGDVSGARHHRTLSARRATFWLR
jgi:hypothetical protein